MTKLPDVQEVNLYDDREKEFAVFRELRQRHPDKQINIFKADEGSLSLINEGNEILYNIVREEVMKRIGWK